MENYHFNYNFIRHPHTQTILFLHGFMGNCNEFTPVIKLLENNFSYLTLDLPGHGKTQVLGGDNYYSMENTAWAIIQLLDQLQIEQCLLVGYSMGGRVSLYLTLHFPQRFIQVVLESASPGLKTEKERSERIQLDEQIARKINRITHQKELLTFLDNWYAQPIFGNIKNHPLFQNMVSDRLQISPTELAKSLRMMGTGNQPSLWEKLSDNQIPLLLLVGEHDQKFIEVNYQMTQLCQCCQFKIISHAGHNIHLENTLAFVETIKVFFAN